MFNNIIESYINKLSLYDINNFAIKNNIYLNKDELEFVYSYIKNNYKTILNNKGNINLEQYKTKFSEENFVKINNLFNEYYKKYKNYL
ncbi:MAG: DUF2624 family protein [Firmicutes bacterium]|nr:DUF2624 family protein [Bacillota bacterium]